MILSRGRFFCCLFLLLGCPFFFAKVWWIVRTRHTVGVMSYVGHDGLGSVLGITTYPVILFQLGRDSIFFNGKEGYDYRPGDLVPVRYRVDDPYDAKIDQPMAVWGDTIVYSLFPVLVWLVLLLTPERFSPLVPRGSKILVGGKWPFVWVMGRA